MAEFDHGMKKIAQTTGRQLARVAGVVCQQWGPIESTLQITTEFLSDRAFIAQQDRERFVVYFEFFTTWHSNGRWDMLAKSGILSQREKLPTMCIPVILQEEGFTLQNSQFRLEVGERPTQQLWFREVCLWKQKPEDWWEDAPGLMALFPLCRHGRPPREAIEHAAGVIERKVVNVGEQADFLALLGIFGKLSYPYLDVKRIIGREQMRASKFYQEIQEEGAVMATREHILKVLRARFKEDPPPEISAALHSLEDLPQLEALLLEAATCASLEAFRAALPGQTANA
jgi:hypothetical protein